MVGERQGKCVNIGNCSLADKREPIVTTAGQDFVCPECGKSLLAATSPAGNSSRRNAIAVMVGLAVVALGGSGFALRSCAENKSIAKPESRMPSPVVTNESSVPIKKTGVPPVESGDCSEKHQGVGICAKTH